MKKHFITATGTDIGKTFITCAIIRQLLDQGKNVCALKPIISGWEDGDRDNDTLKIIDSLNITADQNNIEEISPWRFSAPLSPDIAARNEGQEIVFEDVVDFCRRPKRWDHLLIEGVGGVMVPINKDKTILDLIVELQFDVILVCASYLGAISHALTSLAALEGRGVSNVSIIISQSEDCAGVENMVETLNNFTDFPVVVVPYLKNGDVAPDILELL